MKPRNWVRLVLILLIFTTALQIAGVIAPLWIFLTTDDFTVGVGLFFRIGCEASSGDNCANPAFPADLPFDYDSAHTYDKDEFVAIVWLETISACIGIILCIMMMVYAVGFGVWKKMSNLNTALVLTAILTWLPQVAGLIVYAVFYGKVISRSPDVSAASFPWSALMCFIAALLFIILTILIHARCRYRNYLKNAIPTSADSRMALNPLIKSQLMKRYFTPSPYREDRRQALTSSAYYTDQSQLLDHGFVGDNLVNTGYENRGFNSSRAIEYVNTESRQDNNNRVIETNNLAAGTYGGNNGAVEVNNDFRGTVYEKDLGASVRQNTGGGTQVIERTYVTTTTTDQAQGDYGTRVNVNNYRPEVTEIRREQNWESRDFRTETEDETLPVERIIGKNTLLDRHREYDAFSELDAETIYYTGKEGYKAGIDRREIANLGGEQTSYNRVIRTEVMEPPRQPPPPPPPQTTTEEVIREVTVVERSGAMHRENRHFRISADAEPKDALHSATHYTVHTRTGTDEIPGRIGPPVSGRLPDSGMGDLDDLGTSGRRPVSGESPNPDFSNLTQVPNLLTGGDKFKYDGAHIYRPYAEESY